MTDTLAHRGAASPPLALGLPVYNGARYVGEAITSLLEQTYGDFVLIVSDNASTDDTEEICRTLAAGDERIRYVRRPENIGAVANFNGTFELARPYRTPFFKWCAHDDVCAPRFLERCVEHLQASPDAVLAHPRTVLIDEDGHELVGLAEEGPRARGHTPVQRFRDLVLNEVWCFPIFGVIRTAVLDESGLFLPFSSADKVLLSKLALIGGFELVPEVLFLRRAHDEQLTVMTPAAKAAWAGRRFHRLPEPVLALRGYLQAIQDVELTLKERNQARLVVARLVTQRDKFQKVFRPGPYNYFGWRGREDAEPYGHLNLDRGERLTGVGEATTGCSAIGEVPAGP